MKILSISILGLLALWAYASPPSVHAECRVLTSPETYTAGQVVRDVCDDHGTRTVTLTDSSGVPSSLLSGGTATAAAPTLVEGATASFSFDLAGNARMTLGTLLAGEDQTNNLIQTSGGATRVTQLVGTGGVPSTASDATTTAAILPVGMKTFQGVITCTGTCVQTQKIYGSYTSTVSTTTADLVCTITLNASTTDHAFCKTDLNFSYWFVVTSLTSGTTPLVLLDAYY